MNRNRNTEGPERQSKVLKSGNSRIFRDSKAGMIGNESISKITLY